MPKLVVVERDYPAVADKLGALGPLASSLGATTKGITFDLTKPIDYLGHKNGLVRGGAGDGRPSLQRDVHVCEAILALSGTTNGHLATEGFHTLEKRTGPEAGRPGGRARGQAGHVRGHPGGADAGHHVTRVVRLGVRAAGGTRRSPSTSNASSPGTPSRAGSTSSSTTTG